MRLEDYGLEPLFWAILILGFIGIAGQLYLLHDAIQTKKKRLKKQ